MLRKATRPGPYRGKLSSPQFNAKNRTGHIPSGPRRGFHTDTPDSVVVNDVRRPEVTQESIEPDVAMLRVRGELDMTTVQEFEATVARTAQGESASILIDLSRCAFIDASVIGLLVDLRIRLASWDGRRLAVIAGDQPLRVLRLTGLDGEMPVFTTVQDAVRALDGAPT